MAHVQKLGPKRWRARAIGTDGKEHSKVCKTRTAADSWIAHHEVDTEAGDWVDPRRGKVRLGEYAEDWFATILHLKPATRGSYRVMLNRYVLPKFGATQVAAITRTAVQKWMSELISEGTGSGTVRNAYRVLSRILTEAEASRVIARNPAAGITLPKSQRREMLFLQPAEIGRLSDAIDPRYRALVLTAAYTGARWGELAALRPDRLDLLRGRMDIREALSEVNGRFETVAPKTGERRTVGLPRFLCEALSAHLAEYPGEYVFTSPEGSPLSRTNFRRRVWQKALEAGRLNPATRFHDLRHSAASLAINQGANVKVVQGMLGHSSASVTLDTYSHVFPALSEQLTQGMETAYRDSLTARIRHEDGTRVTSLDAKRAESTG